MYKIFGETYSIIPIKFAYEFVSSKALIHLSQSIAKCDGFRCNKTSKSTHKQQQNCSYSMLNIDVYIYTSMHVYVYMYMLTMYICMKHMHFGGSLLANHNPLIAAIQMAFSGFVLYLSSTWHACTHASAD